MQDPPDLDALRTQLCDAFAEAIAKVRPLALGHDADADVFEAIGRSTERYFVKRKRGPMEPAGALIARLLRDSGIGEVVAPLPTRTGELWAESGDTCLLVYPFVEGRSAWGSGLTDAQWRLLGVALRRMHEVRVPADVAAVVQRETFSPWARTLVRTVVNTATTARPSSAARAALERMMHERCEIERVVEAASTLSVQAARRHPDSSAFVPCHADLHHGNLIVSDGDGISIVDWDGALLAPKERDLMFIGGNIGGIDANPEGVSRFYEGYGNHGADPVLLAYYRYERIVQDLADYCGRAFAHDLFAAKPSGEADILAAVQDLTTQFGPANVVEAADRVARTI